MMILKGSSWFVIVPSLTTEGKHRLSGVTGDSAATPPWDWVFRPVGGSG